MDTTRGAERDCYTPAECRITEGYRTATCMGWTPTYDGYGNQLNRDPNTTRWSEHCSTCGRTWDVELTAAVTKRTPRSQIRSTGRHP